MAISNENATLSYTRSGAPIPAQNSPRKLFEKLFVQGRLDEMEARIDSAKQGRSTLDFVAEQADRAGMLTSLAESLLAADREMANELPRLRRLTRTEYENTIRDLFDLPGIGLAGDLPADGQSHSD